MFQRALEQTIACLCTMAVLSLAVAQSEAHASPVAQIQAVHVGFDGHLTLGRWAPVRIELSSPVPSAAATIAIETRDGDGSPNVIRMPAARAESQPNCLYAMVRPGRRSILTRVTVLDNRGQILAASGADTADAAALQVHPAGNVLTLSLGNDLNLQRVLSAERTRTADSLRSLSVHLRQATDLPVDWRAYEAVSTIVIAASSPDDLPEIDVQQVEAIGQWVAQGGHLIWNLGPAAASVVTDSRWAALWDAEFSGTAMLRDSGRLELSLGAREPLLRAGTDSLELLQFDTSGAEILLASGNLPLVLRRAVGFGRATMSVLDLADQPMAAWPGSVRLLARLLDIEQATEEAPTGPRAGRVAHVGFEDIAGQLRMALDQFRRVPLINFAWVAVLIAAFILMIGPLDYFFLRRVAGQMHWTWLSYGVIIVIFCSAAWFIAQGTRSRAIEINQLEIIDVDAQTGVARGFVWANFYAPQAGHYTAGFGESDWIELQREGDWLSWFGLSGQGLGGMEAPGILAVRTGGYQVLIPPEEAPATAAAAMNDSAGAMIEDLSMSRGSTRSLAGQWTGQIELQARSRLRQHPTSDALTGLVTNPFDVPLQNVIVLYRNWAYALDRPLEPGETIDVALMRERTIKSHFTRRQMMGKEDAATAWRVTDTDLPRIAEIMSVFKSVGGAAYTTLAHRYQFQTDISEQLDLNRAVLLGRVRRPVSPIEITADVAAPVQHDQQWTLIRLFMPVQSGSVAPPRTPPQ